MRTRALKDNFLIKIIASPLIFLYLCINWFRALLYRIGIFRSCKVSRPVISVGNIDMGGSGKTPLVIWLADRLMKNGLKPVIISRGHGRKDVNELIIINPADKWKPDPYLVGDEPAMIARILPDIPIVCLADRVKAAEAAIQEFEPDVLILDDGFQHMRLKRDLDICILPDRRSIWKREFNLALRRTDLILTFNDNVSGWVKKRIPLFKAIRKAGEPNRVKGKGVVKIENLKGVVCASVSGIANGDQFKDMIKSEGIDLQYPATLPDHVMYTQRYLELFEEYAEGWGCKYILTTAKDAVKIELYNIKEDMWLYIPLDIEIENPAKFLEIIISTIDQKK